MNSAPTTFQVDTLYVDTTVYVHDTVRVDSIRQIHDTIQTRLYDTTYIHVHDTTYVKSIEYVHQTLYYDMVKSVHDTLVIDSTRKHPDSGFIWPDSADAAVSLSYDDGYANNLDQAIPDLEAHGFRGTFYIYINSWEMQGRKYDWKKAFQDGHEVGSHGWYHACRNDQFRPEDSVYIPYPLEDYTPKDIMEEIARAASWLTLNIGDDPYRTFAYPCVSTSIGEEKDELSYTKAVMKYHYGARVAGYKVNDPQTVDFYRIQSYLSYQTPLDSLTAYFERAQARNGWAVIMFHGIGGPGLETPRQLHQDLLQYLDDNSYWVAPVRDVLRYIETQDTASSGYAPDEPVSPY